jgi:hypothetical protein
MTYYPVYGSDTVTVVSETQTGIDGVGAGILTTTSTAVKNCRHRPLKTESARGAGMARQQEATQIGVAVATEWWETTAPPVPAILAAKPSDSLLVNGIKYQIISGIKTFRDPMGNPIKVSILSEEQQTGF